MDASIEQEAALGRKAFINGLRELADFLEAHPNVPTPVEVRSGTIDYNVNVFVNTREDMAKALKGSGPWTKEHDDFYVTVSRAFGDGTIEYDLNIIREKVCRKVPTGEVRQVPAKEAHEEPVYKWECNDPLLAPSE